MYAQGACRFTFAHARSLQSISSETLLPVRVLTENDLEDGNLKGIRVLVLPNVAVMSNRAAEVVRRFVKSGGGLIATHETSLYDEEYRKRSDLALGDVLCAKYLRTNVVTQRVENLQLTLDVDHPIINDRVIKSKQNTSWLSPGNPPPKGPLALIASEAEVQAISPGQVLSTYNVNLPHQRRASDILRSLRQNLVRGGSSFTSQPRSTKASSSIPTPTCDKCLPTQHGGRPHDLLPPVEVRGPLILTATFRRQAEKNRILVHLLNQGSSMGSTLDFTKNWRHTGRTRKAVGFSQSIGVARHTGPCAEEVIPLSRIEVTCHTRHYQGDALGPKTGCCRCQIRTMALLRPSTTSKCMRSSYSNNRAER